jgi:hypothetical protein
VIAGSPLEGGIPSPFSLGAPACRAIVPGSARACQLVRVPRRAFDKRPRGSPPFAGGRLFAREKASEGPENDAVSGDG